MTARLVALDLPGGPAFVEALQRVWDDGDAALPVDHRLPEPARRRLLAAMAPAAIVSADGHRRPRRRAAGRARRRRRRRHQRLDRRRRRASSSPTTPSRLGARHQRPPRRHRRRPLAGLPAAVPHRRAVRRHPGAAHGHPLTVHPGFDPVGGDGVGGDARLPRRDRAGAASTRRSSARSCSAAAPPGRPAAQRRDDLRHDRDRQRRRLRRRAARRRRGAGRRRRRDPRAGADAPAGLPRRHRSRCVDGWFATGDLGRWRTDGRLHVDGRRGDLIVTGGENVWPAPVEAVLRRHPAVADVAVAGTVDPEWGQRRHRLRRAVRGAAPTLDQLRDAVKAELPPCCAPRRLVLVVDACPARRSARSPGHRLPAPRTRLAAAADAGAAVDDVGVAGDPARLVAGQEHGQVGDVLGLAQSARSAWWPPS